MKPRIGFFKYDSFPYFTWVEFSSWSDEGNPKTVGGREYKREYLIASFPKDEAQKFTDALEGARNSFREGEKKLKERLSEELYQVAYFLRPHTKDF